MCLACPHRQALIPRLFAVWLSRGVLLNLFRVLFAAIPTRARPPPPQQPEPVPPPPSQQPAHPTQAQMQQQLQNGNMIKLFDF